MIFCAHTLRPPVRRAWADWGPGIGSRRLMNCLLVLAIDIAQSVCVFRLQESARMTIAPTLYNTKGIRAHRQTDMHMFQTNVISKDLTRKLH